MSPKSNEVFSMVQRRTFSPAFEDISRHEASLAASEGTSIVSNGAEDRRRGRCNCSGSRWVLVGSGWSSEAKYLRHFGSSVIRSCKGNRSLQEKKIKYACPPAD